MKYTDQQIAKIQTPEFQEFYEANQALVRFVIDRYFSGTYARYGADIFDEAKLGLMDAFVSFDSEKKTKMSYWATFKIMARVKAFLAKEKMSELFVDIEPFKDSLRAEEQSGYDGEFVQETYLELFDKILPPKEKRVMSAYFECLNEGVKPTSRVLSSKLKCHPITVNSLIKQARNKLKKFLILESGFHVRV